MYTQCPYCNTLFRVRSEQLRAARGQVRCSRCDNIFNALEHLQDTAPAEKEEWPSSLFIEPTAAPPPASAPESPFEQPEADIGNEPESDTSMEFDSILDFSSSPFPESGNIDLDFGEIEPELGGLGSDLGATTPDLGGINSNMVELEETEPDLTELESELEDLVSELDDLDAESEQHLPFADEPDSSLQELASDYGSDAATQAPEVGETTEVRLEKLASQLQDFDSESEMDDREIEDLVSELDELEAEQRPPLPDEPVFSQHESQPGYYSDAETEVGESTDARLERLASQLEGFDSEAEERETEEPASEPGVGESTDIRLERLASQLEGFDSEPEVGEDTDARLEDLASHLEDFVPEETADHGEMEELVSELYRQEEAEAVPEEPIPEYGLETDFPAQVSNEDRELHAPQEEHWEETETNENPDLELTGLMSELDDLEAETETVAWDGQASPPADEPAALETPAIDDTAEILETTAPPEDAVGEGTVAGLTLEAALAAEKGRKSGRLFWGLGSILLILIAIGQSSWLGRQQLMRYPEGRALLESICSVAGCTVPARRAPKRIEVLNRSIISHAELENALQINITFVNRAEFAQPFPQLDIVLYNLEKQPVVRRRFSPLEYLDREPGKEERLQPKQALEVEMVVEDPGKDVTGFKLDFF
jgi:predicted Zn finger-like uncharacterized protein